ncbi:MAG: hypothetical protein COA84_10210 [Robiginitomaculum sp.]|nr:MAG: hypothetical protein COA84_10210 [Robiginitomaculum sp.]
MRETENRSRKYAKQLRRSLTNAEVFLWSRLRKKQLNGYGFRRQHPVGPFIADFACIAEKLIIEIDGATHSTEMEIAHDQRRTAFLENQGWHILRVTNPDVYENLDGVLEAIAAELPPPSASRPPPPHAGEEFLIFKEDK